MTIKIEDIRVGDRVTLNEGVVKTNDGAGSKPILVMLSEHSGVWVDLADIATHTPAPREFKPGDMVTWGTGVSAMRGEIIALDCEMAFIKFGGHYDAVHTCALRHADPAPAPQEAGKERKKIVDEWRNYYDGRDRPCTHATKDSADTYAAKVRWRRIACLHVVGYEGDGL